MRVCFSLFFLLAAGLLAGCAAPVETGTSGILRETSWGPIPDYYVWDGYEYVGFYDDGYYYLGPGENWMAFDVFRLNRFRLWYAAHPDWRRHAVPNIHHRKGRDGNIHPPRPDGRRHHPGDWKDPVPPPDNLPPPPRQEPGRPRDHRDEDRHADRPQGHHPPAPTPPPVPPRTGSHDTGTHPPHAGPPPPRNKDKAEGNKKVHDPGKVPPAPKTRPGAYPAGKPKMTPPAPPAVKPPPPPSIKPPAPPATKPPEPKPPAPQKVEPPRQNDRNTDDKDDGDHRKPR